MTIELQRIGGYATGVFDGSAAEIPAFDPVSQRLFVVNGDSAGIDVLDLSDPGTPTLVQTITLPDGFSPNSVAVKDGLVAVAGAADPITDAGQVFFFDAEGNELGAVAAGALPDMLTFTADGTKILVANEGEPADGVDPDGSVSIITLGVGATLQEKVDGATVATAGFGAFNGKENDLRGDGVVIAPGKTAAQDFEPEYIAVSGDGKTAFVTLQENNALGVVDIATATVKAVVPLGASDFSRDLPQLAQFPVDALPDLGTTAAGETIKLGGFSGLWFEGTDADTGKLKFITVPDRGPNGDPINVDGDAALERPFLLPDYQARVVKFTVDPGTGEVEITDQILLTRADGTTPITGLPNIPGKDEEPVEKQADGTYTFLDYDAFGADLEGVVVAKDGSLWMVDEYRPAIYHFGSDGVLIDRFVPEGTAALLPGASEGDFGSETLPEDFATRRANRGFEAIAYDPDGSGGNGTVYAFIQTPLANPNTATSNASSVIRILGIDAGSGEPVSEHVYLLEKPGIRDAGDGTIDKIGDAAWLGGGRIAVIERGDSLETTAKKFIFEIDLNVATNLLDPGAPGLPAGETLEQQTADDLAALGIVPAAKIKVLNLPSLGYLPSDKPEGLAVLPDGSYAVLNDNDFALFAGSEQIALGLITFDGGGNGLDASDRDGAINIAQWPVYGLYQPDAIASFTIDGATFLITANEGDLRDGESARIKDLTLDPVAFPDAAALQADAKLGRLEVSTSIGDFDGDGDFDALFAASSRGFTIWDAVGNLVFSSGDQFEQITAAAFPDNFNASNDGNAFDNRSDNKGPEPEGVVVGTIGENTYAFIGLERIGGVMTYDITDPTAPKFVQYINARDFTVDPEVDLAGAGDLGPEGLAFISADDSPNGTPLLVVANEVSGSTSIYQIEEPDMPDTFTLQLLHFSDQEAGIPALTDAPNLSGVLNALRNEMPDNTLTLSSGDAYLPGVFFSASASVFGAPGRADVLIQNELGVQAIAFGNHEFDLGTSTLANLIKPAPAANGFPAYPGTAFPYLSSNLNFATDPNLAPLVVPAGQAPLPNSITESVVFTVDGEQIGVVGATTPLLKSISSPGGVGVIPPDPNDIAALAAEIQTSVDQLIAQGIDKIVMLAHMQQFSIEFQLAQLLSGVDIIVAGGSHSVFADETDVLRPEDTAVADYPTLFTGADGAPVAVVNTGANYRYVGRLVVEFDASGLIVPGSIDPDVSGAYATDAAGVAAVGGEDDIDPEIVAIVDQLEAVIAAQDGNVFGITDEFLNGLRAGADPRDGVRTQETNLGDLTADANLAIGKEADPVVVISIKNGGGIRNSIGEIYVPGGGTAPERLPPAGNELAGKPEGGISQIDIQNALSFNNELTLLTLTADGLKQIIEHGVAASGGSATPGQFPQVGGLQFSFDAAKPAGGRVQSLVVLNDDGSIRDVVVLDGKLVGDPSREFRIVTLEFLADGGDSYPFPALGSDRVDLVVDGAPREGEATFADDGTEQDALAEYLAANFADPGNAFDQVDTTPEEDQRIQNLAFRDDGIDEAFSGFDDVIVGGDRADALSGGSGSQFMLGLAGDDTLSGGSGDDSLAGGADDDSLNGGSGEDTIDGGSGDDTLFGGSNGDQLIGGDGEDSINAGSGNDSVNGGAGDDTILGADGNDTVVAGGGDDEINAGSGNDTVDGGSGDDTILGADGNDSLQGGEGDDEVSGGAGNDVLRGFEGDDAISGGDGRDSMLGSSGDDTLDGGAGADTMRGGPGDDLFVLRAGEGGDLILDFRPGFDLIGLAGGLTFDDLTLTEGGGDETIIFANDELLATVMGHELTDADFILV